MNDYWKGVQYIYTDLVNSIPYSPDVKQMLDIMLVKRSLIAINNSALSTNILTAWNEINEIVNDSLLNKVINELNMTNTQQFNAYRRLMTSHKKWLVICKYMLRHIKMRFV